MTKRNERIRVLHIITNLPVGGAQDNTLITVERLNREKYDVSLICSSEGHWVRRALQMQDLNLIFVDELTRKIQTLYDMIALWRIYKIIKKGQFTIVHTHSSKPGFIGRIAAKLAGVPIIIHTIHGFPFHDFMSPAVKRFYIYIERFLSKLSDKLITVSTLNLEKAVRLKLAERENFVNVYSGIDFDKFDVSVDVEAKKRELGILNGEKIVGMVGRFSQQKAPLDFIRAIPEVLKQRNNVRFVLVGDGELKQDMYELAEKLDIDSKIMFMGFREDVPELLRVLDVFVLTSLWEGLGRSLTEAMYTGRPIVATDVEGVPELVKNGKTGILVQPQDVHSIAQGILELLSDRELSRQLGQAAKQKISDEFDAEHMVTDLEEVYRQVLDSKKNKTRV
ncbi:MAG: glycosyltransferase family 4 protein [bacterium]